MKVKMGEPSLDDSGNGSAVNCDRFDSANDGADDGDCEDDGSDCVDDGVDDGDDDDLCADFVGHETTNDEDDGQNDGTEAEINKFISFDRNANMQKHNMRLPFQTAARPASKHHEGS